MAQIPDNIVFDHQYCEDSENIIKDLNECQKHLDLLQKYRKVFYDFAVNCVCDPTKDIKSVFNCLEVEYNEIFKNNFRSEIRTQEITETTFERPEDWFATDVRTDNKVFPKTNICKNSPKIKIKTSEENPIIRSKRPIVCESVGNIGITEDNGHHLKVLKPIKTYSSRKSENTTKEITKTTIELAEEVLPEANKIEAQFSPINIGKSIANKRLKTTEENLNIKIERPVMCGLNVDITRDSAQNLKFLKPIKTYSSVKPLTLIPKTALHMEQGSVPITRIEKKLKTTENSITRMEAPVMWGSDTNDGITHVVVHNLSAFKPIKTFSRVRPLSLIPKGALLMEQPQKFDKKYYDLMDELKTGKLDTFIDPNNPMISVNRKTDSVDAQNYSDIYFKCNFKYCEFETKERHYLTRHILRHRLQSTKGSAKKYKIFCGFLEDLKSGKIDSFIDPEFQTVSVFLRENEEQNEKTVVYKCLQIGCEYESNTKFDIKNHISKHRKDIRFECDLCEADFSSKVLLIEHRIAVHNVDHNLLFKCDFPDCGYKTTVRAAIERHFLSHTDEKPVKCDFEGCDQYFKCKNSVKYHKKNVHTPNKWFKCEWNGCDNRSKSIHEMRKHYLSHTGEKVTVGMIRNILKNGNYVSTVDKDNQFSVIRKQFINESTGKIEVGPKLGFKCNHTDCTFITLVPSFLKQHIMSHSIGKSFQCDLCHKKFDLKRQLKSHQKFVHDINNEGLVITCRYCEYRTKNTQYMRQHLAIHELETPYVCNQNGCDRRYKTEARLNGHIKYCHGDRPYFCEFPECKVSFKVKSSLRRHLKSEHNSKIND